MRDAFGGVFMIRIILVVLFIYVSFSAISLNYAKAFKVKNSIIDIVEENDIKSIKKIENNNKIDEKIDGIVLSYLSIKDCSKNKKVTDSSINYCDEILISLKKEDARYTYYNVITYAKWDLGTLTNILSFSPDTNNNNDKIKGAWKISGTAKVAKE